MKYVLKHIFLHRLLMENIINKIIIIQRKPEKITWEDFVFFLFVLIKKFYLIFKSMKKILVLVLVSVAIATSAFALSPSDYNAFYKLNSKTAFTTLIGYIDADQEQVNFLKHVFQVTETELKQAEKKGSDMAIENVVNYNLQNSKVILSEEQYKKYLAFVNYYVREDSYLASLNVNK